MDKKATLELGERVLENTIKVIMNLPEDEKMVVGMQVLSKKEIISKFWEDPKFAFDLASRLDKSVKEFLFRAQWKKTRRNAIRNTDGS